MLDNVRPADRACAGSKPDRPGGRPPFKRIALLLQGGGALGAYQGGVYEALAEAGLHPDWTAGISIGAINAAARARAPQVRIGEPDALDAGRQSDGFERDQPENRILVDHQDLPEKLFLPANNEIGCGDCVQETVTICHACESDFSSVQFVPSCRISRIVYTSSPVVTVREFPYRGFGLRCHQLSG